MEFEFDQDIAVTRVSAGHYAANISANWNITTVPDGGYLLAVVANAMRDHLPHPDPFSVTGHFLKPVISGPAVIRIQTLKVGKGISFAEADLNQGGERKLRVTAAFGSFDARSGITHCIEKLPEIPPFDDCVRANMPLELFKHLRVALTPESGRWLSGQLDEVCELIGWNSFSDGREADDLSLLLFADGYPPPVFRKIGTVGWVPTIEMTVQIHNRPAPGPLRCRFTSRHINGGYAEEDGEIWDSEGKLVALSRQLETIRIPQPKE